MEDNCGFTSLSCDKRHLKRKKTLSYRLINRYYKSTKQYWKERNRGKQIMELRYVQFLSQKEIATKLGISVSTVKRDLEKAARHMQGQTNKAIRLMQDEWKQKYEKALEGLSLRERFDYLRKLIVNYRKTWQGREYNRHVIKFFIDLDYIKYDGFPKIKTWPQHATNLTLPHILKFICIKNGKQHELPPNVIIRNVQPRRW